MTTTSSRPAVSLSMPVNVPPDASTPRPAVPLPTPGDPALGGVTNPHPTVSRATPMDSTSGASTSRPANAATTPVNVSRGGRTPTGRHAPSDTHGTAAAGDSGPGPTAKVSTSPASESLLDPALALAADVVDDLERVRIANENRLRQLTRTATDADGQDRGFGLHPDHPDVIRLGLIIELLKKAEHDGVLQLQRQWRRHPLASWAAGLKGVGEKQIARLVAAIGDPYLRPAYTTTDDNGVETVVDAAPRTVSQLWAYHGLHTVPADQPTRDTHDSRVGGLGSLGGDRPVPRLKPLPPVLLPPFPVRVAARRQKGVQSNWSNTAKMRVFLIAESCIKQLGPDCRDGHVERDTHPPSAVPAPNAAANRSQRVLVTRTGPAAVCCCSPYRVVYDQRRTHTATTHPDWTDGHSHQDALRVAGKRLLRDLWRAAMAYHVERGVPPIPDGWASQSPTGGQLTGDTQGKSAAGRATQKPPTGHRAPDTRGALAGRAQRPRADRPPTPDDLAPGAVAA